MAKQLEALIAEMKAAAGKATQGQWVTFSHPASSTYSVHTKGCARTDDVINWPGFDGRDNARNNAAFVALFNPENAKALIAALEQAQALATQQGNIACALFDEVTSLRRNANTNPLAMPEGIHPDTANLVTTFAEVLAAKLRKSEIKYGYDSDWKKDGWQGQCLAHFHQHIGKGDPLDVAAYCAFMWHHKWPTAASPLAVKLSNASQDVLAERHRQVSAEGWSSAHDDQYQNSELPDAAACYAINAHNQGFSTPAHWPWPPEWWKQTNPRRDLVKAGALILAEIERIDRAAGGTVEGE